jgi:hypothetical protein
MSILYTKHYTSGKFRGMYRDAKLGVSDEHQAHRWVKILMSNPNFELTDVRVEGGVC